MSDWLTSEPEDRQLKSAPVQLAVCQIRHEHTAAISDPNVALQIHNGLGWTAKLEEHVAQDLTIDMTSQGPPAPSQPNLRRGWRFKDGPGHYIATVMPDNFSLETTAYSDWSTFKSHLQELLSAVLAYVSPRLEHRTGLRFVNELRHPSISDISGWSGLIDDRLFQTELFAEVAGRARAAMQVIEVDVADDVSLVVRHGAHVDRTEQVATYVIDNDCARNSTRELTEKNVVSSIDELHRLALQAFEMATTETLRKMLEEGWT